jgi:hypothetical protein
MVDAIMAREAPLREDALMQRIARAHGWLRTGGRIRDQIAKHLRDGDVGRTRESAGVFLWRLGTVAPRVPFRGGSGRRYRRAISEICLAEIADFILAHPDVMEEDDPVHVYARLMHVDRLSASARERLQEAVAYARKIG